MIAVIRGTSCLLALEEGDPRMSSDSTVLHHLKLALNKQGYDLVKLRMGRDGHMVSDEQQYLRARNPKRPARGGLLCIWDTSYAVRFLHSELRERGEAILTVELEEIRWVLAGREQVLAEVLDRQRRRVKLRRFSAEGACFGRSYWTASDKVVPAPASDPRIHAAEMVRRREERARARQAAERRSDHAHEARS